MHDLGGLLVLKVPIPKRKAEREILSLGYLIIILDLWVFLPCIDMSWGFYLAENRFLSSRNTISNGLIHEL